jgi:hypothetical protein
LLTHTEVASRDSIGYIRIAWQLEHTNWLTALPAASQHPAYPAAILMVSWAVRPFFESDLPTAMQVSAQVASSLASVLLVVPMFYLGRELFDRRIAFWATALFQCLPSSGRVMADGLSEPLFLLWIATGLLFAVRGLRNRSPWCFAVVGLSGGLAYLTRPEGLVLILATGLVLLVMQILPHLRFGWRSFLKCGVSLTLATLVLAAPFMILIGGISVKTTAKNVLKQQEGLTPWLRKAEKKWDALQPNRAGISSSPALFAIWQEGPDLGPAGRYGWAAQTMRDVFLRAFFFVWWAPGLLGLWLFRDRFWKIPGAWVLLVSCLILLAALYRVAVVMGYLSDRHTLLIVMCVSYWAVAGLDVVGRWLASALAWWRPVLTGGAWTNPRGWTLGLLMGLTGLPLVRTLEPLHADRVGFKQAGRWLAQNTYPGDYVEDPYSWTSFYAGRVFLEGATDLPAHEPAFSYIVLENAPNRHPHLVYWLDQARLWAQTGHVVQRWELVRNNGKAELLIYAIPQRYPWETPAKTARSTSPQSTSRSNSPASANVSNSQQVDKMRAVLSVP